MAVRRVEKRKSREWAEEDESYMCKLRDLDLCGVDAGKRQRTDKKGEVQQYIAMRTKGAERFNNARRLHRENNGYVTGNREDCKNETLSCMKAVADVLEKRQIILDDWQNKLLEYSVQSKQLHSYKCDLCKSGDISGEQSVKDHINGRKHQKKLREAAASVRPRDSSVQSRDSSVQSRDSSVRSRDSSVQSRDSSVRSRDSSVCANSDADTTHVAKSPFYCEVCDTTMSGPENMAQHLNGKLHQKKLRATDAAKLFVSNTDLQINPSGNCHEGMPTAMETSITSLSQPEVNSLGLNTMQHNNLQVQNNPYYCDICHTTMSGPENMVQHLNGKLHQKKLRATDAAKLFLSSTVNCHEGTPTAMETSITSLSQPETNSLDLDSMPQNKSQPQHNPYYCEVCDTTMSGPEPMTQHLNGKLHQKKQRSRTIIASQPLNGLIGTDVQLQTCPSGNCDEKMEMTFIHPQTISWPSTARKHEADSFDTKNQQKILLLKSLPVSSQKTFNHQPEKTSNPQPSVVSSPLDKVDEAGVNANDRIVRIRNSRVLVRNRQLDEALYIANDDGFYCRICDRTITGAYPMKVHNVGDEHMNNLAKRKSMR